MRMTPDELERRLRERLDALGPAPRAELLHVLRLPDFDRADAIGSYSGNPATRTFGELLIDCEEDPALRAVLVGMLREAAKGSVSIAERTWSPRRLASRRQGPNSSRVVAVAEPSWISVTRV